MFSYMLNMNAVTYIGRVPYSSCKIDVFFDDSGSKTNSVFDIFLIIEGDSNFSVCLLEISAA